MKSHSQCTVKYKTLRIKISSEKCKFFPLLNHKDIGTFTTKRRDIYILYIDPQKESLFL